MVKIAYSYDKCNGMQQLKYVYQTRFVGVPDMRAAKT